MTRRRVGSSDWNPGYTEALGKTVASCGTSENNYLNLNRGMF